MSDKKIRIVLTNERPRLVSQMLWPLVAKASEDRDHNNQELSRRHYLRVRLHATPDLNGQLAYYTPKGMREEDAPTMTTHPDNRCIVYGWSESSWQGERGTSSGYIGTLDEAPALIRQVAQEIGCYEALTIDCIGDLPEIVENGDLEPEPEFCI